MDIGNIQKRIFKVSKTEEHTAICKEMSEFYGKPCYWIPYKFHISKVKTVFFEQQKSGDMDFTHLLQRLNH